MRELKSILERLRHKKNVDSGSTFKTFVDSLPRVKNDANVIHYFYLSTKMALKFELNKAKIQNLKSLRLNFVIRYNISIIYKHLTQYLVQKT